jgi:tellurite methyltransferase
MTDRKLHPAREISPPDSGDSRPQRDWPEYYDTVDGAPRETLLKVLELFEAEPAPARPRRAVDLGCGEGRDTAELIRRGWLVVAIDGHREAVRRVRARPGLSDEPRLSVVQGLLEEVHIPPVDLVVASFSLPFCRPERFEGLWGRIVGAIGPGGRFCGQLFGDRDSWAVLPERTHHTRGQVDGLLAPFEAEHFEEAEKDGNDALGDPKHWHVFHVVARKRG